MPGLRRRLVDALLSRARAGTRSRPRRGSRRASARVGAAEGARGGDRYDYAPTADGRPDPGEVVWAWVPFEEDDGRGKDRPVLLVGRRGTGAGLRWLGLMLTSKDHDRDAADEARWGRYWMDVGTGAWDRERRPSEVRRDRLLVLEPGGIRREGAALDRATFDRVLAAARAHHTLP